MITKIARVLIELLGIGSLLVLVSCDTASTPSVTALVNSPGIVLKALRKGVYSPNIYAVDPNGHGELTTSFPREIVFGDEPAWSQDGLWIAFGIKDEVTNLSQLYIARSSDIAQRHRITDPNEGGRSPAWSPDGSHILWVSSDGLLETLDVTCYLQGTQCSQSSSSLVYGDHPAWSPDGRFIAYEAMRQSGTNSIFIIDQANPNKPVILTPSLSHCFSPVWSPSQTIAFSCNSDIYLASPDGSAPRKIISDANNPAWSPDGKQIAFTSRRGGLGAIIGIDDTIRSNAAFVINADGSGLHRVSTRDDEYILWVVWPTVTGQTH